MQEEKIRPMLSGTAETMLQSFYARAKYSKRKNHKFYDAKAVEVVEKLDYDFRRAEKDAAMSSGVIARTLVFDELVKAFIAQHPDCTVVNLACGLDTRVYRLDNGRLTWYNLDLPQTIAVRQQLFHEEGRISTIAASVLDPAWPAQVTVRGRMLFVIEGLSMYLTGAQVAQMLGIIRDRFDNAYVLMECLAPMWVAKQGVERSIQKTGAEFKWGANAFAELGDLAKGFQKVKDDNILRGMRALNPLFALVDRLPIAQTMTQKILVFEKA